jgi:hypothetical protein
VRASKRRERRATRPDAVAKIFLALLNVVKLPSR